MISEAVLMDNMEYMAKFPDKYFDLAVVDPPYGIGASKQSKGISKIKGRENSIVQRSNLKSKEWDDLIPTDDYFNELFRTSKDQIIWGGNYMTKYLYATNSWIIWNKLQKLQTRSDGEMAWTSFKNPLIILPLLHDGFKRGQNVGYNQPVIYNVPHSGKQTIHPTQKPVALYDWIYAKYLPEGGKVLDTHLGSGSNRIAADKAGNIDFYSCENDPDHYADQEKRWKNYKSQLVLQF